MSKAATLCLSILATVLATVLALPTAWAADEPAIEGDEAALPFLRAVHAKLHPLWAGNFLLLAASQLPKNHPINLPSRRVELDVVLSAKGAVLDVRVAKSSGATEFDTSAVESIRAAGTFPPASEAVLSDDGKVHLKWSLARDHRGCSGLALSRRELPLAEAVRALVLRDRDALAIARLQAAEDSERAAAMDAFARAWLDRNEQSKDLALAVAVANALAGDARGAETLRKAVDLGDSGAHDARTARGLAALKIPICPLIRASLAKQAKASEGADGATHTDAEFSEQLRTKPVRPRVLSLIAEGTSDACLAFAEAIAKDRSAPGEDRAFAIMSLEHSDAPEARAVLRALTKDPDPQIQSQAIRAEAHPDAGRSAVFRLTPLLRDKSVLVRSAAAAALIRVGGETVLPQLFLLHKEKDPAVYLAVTAELAKLSGAGSAQMLGRLLKKDSYEIQLAAARALAARRDEHAAKLQATLGTSDRPELQLLSGLALAKDQREAAVDALADSEVDFEASYSALLRGSARIVAADWLLARFPKLAPGQRAERLGEWLATRPQGE